MAKSTDIRSKAVVLLLLIHCLNAASVSCLNADAASVSCLNAASVSCGIFVFDPCLVMQYLVQLSRRGRESWLLTSIMSMQSCGCKCSVCDAVSWAVVCDCGIAWSYSLAFW